MPATPTPLAQTLQTGIAALGYSFLVESPTNQIFPFFRTPCCANWKKDYEYEVQQPMKDRSTCIRLVTSWATPEEAVTISHRLDPSEQIRIHPRFSVLNGKARICF